MWFVYCLGCSCLFCVCVSYDAVCCVFVFGLLRVLCMLFGLLLFVVCVSCWCVAVLCMERLVVVFRVRSVWLGCVLCWVCAVCVVVFFVGEGVLLVLCVVMFFPVACMVNMLGGRGCCCLLCVCCLA